MATASRADGGADRPLPRRRLAPWTIDDQCTRCGGHTRLNAHPTLRCRCDGKEAQTMATTTGCAHPELEVEHAEVDDAQFEVTVKCLGCGARGVDYGPIDNYDVNDCDRALSFDDRVCGICGELIYGDPATPGRCDEHEGV